jgi:hypothetical protein
MTSLMKLHQSNMIHLDALFPVDVEAYSSTLLGSHPKTFSETQWAVAAVLNSFPPLFSQNFEVWNFILFRYMGQGVGVAVPREWCNPVMILE